MKFYSATDVGRVRSINQDYIFASGRPVGKLPNLFVVADGMGGHNAGDRASSYAVEVLLDSIRKSRERNPVKNMRQAIERANRKVLRESNSDERYRGMGTTIVAATVIRGTLYVANVGDSRLYIVQDHIRQITRDHSLVEEMIRLGNLSREEGRRHPDKNIITRAVGVDQTVEIDFFEVKLGKRDRILMCSDGLSNMIEDEEIEQIIKKEKSLPKAGEKLIATANQNGGCDNISVLLVAIETDEVK